MKHIYFLFIFLFLALVTNAQDPEWKTESDRIIQLQISDAEKADKLAQLAGKLSKKDLNAGIAVCERIESFSKGNPLLEGKRNTALAEVYRRNFKNDKAIDYSKRAIQLFQPLEEHRGLSMAHEQWARAAFQAEKIKEADEHFALSVNEAKLYKDPERVIDAFDGYRWFLGKQSNQVKLFEVLTDKINYGQDVLKGNDMFMASAHIDMAYYYFRLEKWEDTRKSIDLALPYAQRSGNEYDLLDCYNTAGAALKNLKKYDEAISYFQKAIQVLEKTEGPLKSFLGPLMLNVGITYYEQGKNREGLETKLKGLAICEKEDNTNCVYNANVAIGIDLVELDKNYEQAIPYLLKAESMMSEDEDLFSQQYLYKGLHKAFAGSGKFEKAYEYQTKYIAIRDSSLNSEKQKQLGELEAKYENAKKEQLIEVLNRDKTISQLSLLRKQEELERESAENEAREKSILLLEKENDLKKTLLEQEKTKVESERSKTALAEHKRKLAEQEISMTRRVNILFGFGTFFLLIFLVSLYRGYRAKKKAHEEISSQKEIIQRQKEIVEERNREVMDSIAYAKRLQEAILPASGFIRDHFPKSFIYYQPKDVVAGDFYWMEKSKSADGKTWLFFAVADCTGHGVPGAMVSVVCSNALHRAVNEFQILKPGSILDKVRDLVIETFSSDSDQVKDGMDISLCAFCTDTKELLWSGANNPLVIIRSGEILEIKGDKQPIGRFEHAKPFTTHQVHLQENDMLYLFSDGYADQFGGVKSKKFKESNLKKLLSEISAQSLREQEAHLQKVITDWKGDLEQVDDICLMGISLF